MKTRITFDAALSPAALRTMADAAAAQRDVMDGVSATHWTAWNNLTLALAVEAEGIEARDERTIDQQHEDAGCYNCEGRCGIARHAAEVRD